MPMVVILNPAVIALQLLIVITAGISMMLIPKSGKMVQHFVVNATMVMTIPFTRFLGAVWLESRLSQKRLTSVSCTQGLPRRLGGFFSL